MVPAPDTGEHNGAFSIYKARCFLQELVQAQTDMNTGLGHNSKAMYVYVAKCCIQMSAKLIQLICCLGGLILQSQSEAFLDSKRSLATTAT